MKIYNYLLILIIHIYFYQPLLELHNENNYDFL